MLFKLKKNVGSHSQGGRLYVAGDVVESEDDLTLKFVNKFERVHENETIVVSKGTLELGPGIPTPASVKGEDDKGDDETEPLSSPEPEPTSETDTEEPEKVVEGEHGTDVTNLFPTAGELDMKVFVKAHWYSIVDTEDNKVLNEKKIREDDVQGFLESYAGSDDDDDEEGDD